MEKGLATYYGMEMDSYKSRISDGVLVQKRNRTSWCLKLHASVSQLFSTKRTHSRGPGVKGEALFSKLQFFDMSADRRSVRIRILICKGEAICTPFEIIY